MKKPVLDDMLEYDQGDRDQPGRVPEKIPELEYPHKGWLKRIYRGMNIGKKL